MIKVSKKKRLENARGSLQYQYGERGRQLAQLRFNKHYTELNLEEFDKLFEELHSTSYTELENKIKRMIK